MEQGITERVAELITESALPAEYRSDARADLASGHRPSRSPSGYPRSQGGRPSSMPQHRRQPQGRDAGLRLL